MDIGARLRDLAGKIESRLDAIRARLTTLESAPPGGGTAVTVGPTAPSSPSLNQLWVDTN